MAQPSDLENALAAVRHDPTDPSGWTALHRCLNRLTRAHLCQLREWRPDVHDEIADEALLKFFIYCPWRHDWTRLPSAGQVVAYLKKTVRTTLLTRRHREHVEAAAMGQQADTDPDSCGTEDVETDEALLRRISVDLTREELELLALLQERQSLGDIAKELGINYTTAAGRVHRLKKKMLALMNAGRRPT